MAEQVKCPTCGAPLVTHKYAPPPMPSIEGSAGEFHACMTGDCPHSTQAECDKALADAYRDLFASDRDRTT